MKSYQLVPSAYITDYESVVRPWRERLFSLPWRPWTRTKRIFSPKIFKLADGVYHCSYQTYQRVLHEEQKDAAEDRRERENG